MGDLFDDKIEELTGYAREDFTTRRVKWSDLILSEDLEGLERYLSRPWRATNPLCGSTASCRDGARFNGFGIGAR